MDDVESRLNSSDPAVIPLVVSRLVAVITERTKKGDRDIPELRFLKEKCTSHDNSVNLVASKALLKLVECNILDVKAVLSDFVTTITTSKCSPNVAFLINNLLLIDIEAGLNKNGVSRCQFNLRLPQHPFIIMLNEDQNSWKVIFREIYQTFHKADDDAISIYNEAYKPLFLYTICDPYGNNLSNFKQKMWTFIIHNESPLTSDKTLFTLLSWMQLESTNSIEINSDLIIELSELNLERNIFDPDLLLLIQVSALYQLILNQIDPRTMIFSIKNVLEYHDDLLVLNTTLLILAKAISNCSSVFLRDLLDLTKLIIKSSNLITGGSIKAALLHWMANPSIITSDSVETGNETLTLLSEPEKTIKTTKRSTRFYKKFENMINSYSEIYFSIQLNIIEESWTCNGDVLNFLQNLDSSPTFFLVKILNFLEGLFLVDFNNSEIDLRVFGLINRCVDFNAKKFSGRVLTLILHKITKVTDPELHLILLKSLPKMGAVKDNLQKVLATLKALNRGPNKLKSFSTTLMFELWKLENRVYTHLENLLIVPYDGVSDKWEFYITRAFILNEICALRPELYGKEIVAHLSRILNECPTSDGATACALAVEGIASLCRFEVIDAVTTWATLAPMLDAETRPAVIKSVCKLIREIPALSYADAYPQLTKDVVAKLWEYLKLNGDTDVWEAALDAMIAFGVDTAVAAMPEEFLDEEIVEARRSLLTGLCWISFLMNCQQQLLKIVGDFLVKMIRIEISGYLKYVYQVKGTREPLDYAYVLPQNSVVRGIAAFIKSKLLKWKGSVDKEVYLECLRIFSEEYGKPLPPLDWCFLQELVHEPEAKDYCVQIAAHQVIISGTARRFIVNYIEAITQNPNDADTVILYKNLKHLANSIQPITIKPFLEVTLKKSIELFEEGDENLLLTLLEHLKTTLDNGNIQEANKIVAASIINEFIEKTDISLKLFDVLVECLIKAPIKSIDEISSPKAVKEMTSEWFKKAVKIRSRLALETRRGGLNLLNDIIESGCDFPESFDLIYSAFPSVFKAHKDNTESALWVLELIGQIQAMIADKYEKKKLMFLCDIFILATIVFSGFFIFVRDADNRREMNKVFPRAIASLLDINHWSICTNQALEWFYHVSVEDVFEEEYRDMFGQCLKAMRHEEEFKKNMKWIKYLNIEC